MGLEKLNLPSLNELSEDYIENSFLLYKHFKKDSEYFIEYNGQKIPTSKFLAFDEKDKEFVEITDGKNGVVKMVYKKELIERLNPDLIDSKKFWDTAVKYFPHYSMVNSYKDITNKEDLKELSNLTSKTFGILSEVESVFENNETPKILEIGPGYGNIPEYLNAYGFSDENYYAIDLNYYFWHERLFKCDGKSIPDDVPKDLDIIFASNVFAHLGQEQRKSYYKYIYEWLKPGASFVFNMFLITKFNKDKNCWQTIDEDGNLYCKFFNQLTLCDSVEQLIKENGEYFDIDVINLIQMNAATIKFVKK